MGQGPSPRGLESIACDSSEDVTATRSSPLGPSRLPQAPLGSPDPRRPDDPTLEHIAVTSRTLAGNDASFYLCHMAGNPHQLAEARSLAAHRLIAQRLRQNPELVLRARERVADWAARETVNPHYCRAWQAWLALPLPELLRRLEGTDEEARALRQVTPFAGVLSPRQRWRIWKRVRETNARQPKR